MHPRFIKSGSHWNFLFCLSLFAAPPPIRNFLRSRHGEVLATLQEAAAKAPAEAIVQDYIWRA
jgi:F0F1-type ATP synthase membrane subunit b/b'